MSFTAPFTLVSILKHYKSRIAITWLLVVIENGLMVLIPLLLGLSIDGLLNGDFSSLIKLATLLLTLTFVAVFRRFYDTRVYGKIRVEFGESVDKPMRNIPTSTKQISVRNGRLDMSRELVDFLEDDLPPLMTGIIQLVASMIILASFSLHLGASALIASVCMLAVYFCFHQQFSRLNGALNYHYENQVNVLSRSSVAAVRRHLERIKHREIMISDTEAIVYGLIFIVLFTFVMTNIWLATQLSLPTAGTIFSTVTYSLEFVEAAIMLPITLQTLSRLTEISERLNNPKMRATEPAQPQHAIGTTNASNANTI